MIRIFFVQSTLLHFSFAFFFFESIIGSSASNSTAGFLNPAVVARVSFNLDLILFREQKNENSKKVPLASKMTPDDNNCVPYLIIILY